MATERLTQDEFSTLTKQLEAAYRTRMTQAEKDAYWTIWKQFPFSVLVEALGAYMGSDQADFFPKAPSIVPHADRIWRDRGLTQHAEIKAAERLGWRQIEDRNKDDVGRATLPLIQAYLAEEIEKAAYVAGIRALDQRFPGLGFAASADEVASVGSVAIKP
jgi:hypothetical protein